MIKQFIPKEKYVYYRISEGAAAVHSTQTAIGLDDNTFALVQTLNKLVRLIKIKL